MELLGIAQKPALKVLLVGEIDIGVKNSCDNFYKEKREEKRNLPDISDSSISVSSISSYSLIASTTEQ